jgi:hypothetical protein
MFVRHAIKYAYHAKIIHLPTLAYHAQVEHIYYTVLVILHVQQNITKIILIIPANLVIHPAIHVPDLIKLIVLHVQLL